MVLPLHKPIPIAGILDPYTNAYPEKLKTTLIIEMENGQKFTREKSDYHGFFTRPFSWEDTIGKYKKLTGNMMEERNQDKVIDMINNFENHKVRDLIPLLEAKKINSPAYH